MAGVGRACGNQSTQAPFAHCLCLVHPGRQDGFKDVGSLRVQKGNCGWADQELSSIFPPWLGWVVSWDAPPPPPVPKLGPPSTCPPALRVPSGPS